jgi:hypothetical protein
MTAISPKVLCQCSFFYLPPQVPVRLQRGGFRVSQALAPVAQQFLSQRPQFFNRPPFGLIRSLQIPSGILNQVKHSLYSRLHRRVSLQSQAQFVT